MKVVWKFELSHPGLNRIKMPIGARVLHVAEQSNRIQLWALVDPAAGLCIRSFLVAPTGGEIEDEIAANPVCSFFVRGGSLVWHVFEMPA